MPTLTVGPERDSQGVTLGLLRRICFRPSNQAILRQQVSLGQATKALTNSSKASIS